MRFIWGVVGVIIGILLLKYTFRLVNTFGQISWAERYLGSGFGGTYTLYKIIGIVVMIMSLMYMFGAIDILISPFSGIFGGLKE